MRRENNNMTLFALLSIVYTLAYGSVSVAQDNFVKRAESAVAVSTSFSANGTVSALSRQAEKLLESQKISPPQNLEDLQAIKTRAETLSKSRDMNFGGVDTGGGTLVKLNQHTGVLDLYLYNRAAFYDSIYINSNVQFVHNFKNGLEEVQKNHNPIFYKTMRQIQKWQRSSPIFTEALLQTFKYVPFIYKQGSLELRPLQYYLPPGTSLSRSQMSMGALYIDNVGIVIRFDEFSKLSEKNQMALLIHEVLRELNTVSFFSMSNERLQYVTAMLVQDPINGKTLDDFENLGPVVAGNILRQYALIKKIQLIVPTACANFSFVSAECSYVYKDLPPAEYFARTESLFHNNFQNMDSQMMNSGNQKQSQLSGLFEALRNILYDIQKLDMNEIMREFDLNKPKMERAIEMLNRKK